MYVSIRAHLIFRALSFAKHTLCLLLVVPEAGLRYFFFEFV